MQVLCQAPLPPRSEEERGSPAPQRGKPSPRDLLRVPAVGRQVRRWDYSPAPGSRRVRPEGSGLKDALQTARLDSHLGVIKFGVSREGDKVRRMLDEPCPSSPSFFLGFFSSSRLACLGCWCPWPWARVCCPGEGVSWTGMPWLLFPGPGARVGGAGRGQGGLAAWSQGKGERPAPDWPRWPCWFTPSEHWAQRPHKGMTVAALEADVRNFKEEVYVDTWRVFKGTLWHIAQ